MSQSIHGYAIIHRHCSIQKCRILVHPLGPYQNNPDKENYAKIYSCYWWEWRWWMFHGVVAPYTHRKICMHADFHQDNLHQCAVLYVCAFAYFDARNTRFLSFNCTWDWNILPAIAILYMMWRRYLIYPLMQFLHSDWYVCIYLLIILVDNLSYIIVHMKDFHEWMGSQSFIFSLRPKLQSILTF